MGEEGKYSPCLCLWAPMTVRVWNCLALIVPEIGLLCHSVQTPSNTQTSRIQLLLAVLATRTAGW